MTLYPSDLSLPGIRIGLSGAAPDGERLLVAGGRAPSVPWLQAAAEGRRVVAIDRGIDACRAAGIIPARLIGDGDSASPEAWAWARRHGVPTLRFPKDKDETDTQLALREDDEAGGFVILTGTFGGRFDHAYSALYSLVGAGLSGCLADDREILFLLRAGCAARFEPDRAPKVVSLLPLTDVCEGVDLSGVHWPLTGARLERLRPYAVSNRLDSPEGIFEVEIGAGLLGVYLCRDEDVPG